MMAGYQTSRRLQNKLICGKYSLPLGQKTLIMGVVNTTPDSFSDGGKFLNKNDAVKHCLKLISEGADILDIGGESTRPDSNPVSESEEIERTIPVIREVSKEINIPISIDTQKALVARKALDAGASLINDVSALRDPEMSKVAAEYDAPVVLMHMKGTPATMQNDPKYENIISKIKDFFASRIEYAEMAGISRNKIIIDPGIGFGKTLEHNIEIFRHLDTFCEFELPVLVGPSRKTFIGKITGADINNRVFGTAAAIVISILNGANIIRVHDVKEMREVALVADAVVYR